MSSSSKLQTAVARIERSRRNTNQFLEGLTADEWFWHPSEFVTHLAWQAGHLAVAQYNLCLRRIRGRTAADDALITEDFIKHFTLGSTPVADPAGNPPLAEIQRVFAAVHAQALAELATRTDEELEGPVEPPHPAFKTKLDAIDFSASHELIHAGQIALLRRMMGKKQLR